MELIITKNINVKLLDDKIYWRTFGQHRNVMIYLIMKIIIIVIIIQ
jgi:hypothetical protein